MDEELDLFARRDFPAHAHALVFGHLAVDEHQAEPLQLLEQVGLVVRRNLSPDLASGVVHGAIGVLGHDGFYRRVTYGS